MLRQLMHSSRLELPCFLFQLSYSGRFKQYNCNFIFCTPCEHKIPVWVKNQRSTRDMNIKMQPYSLYKRFHVPSLAYLRFSIVFAFCFFASFRCSISMSSTFFFVFPLCLDFVHVCFLLFLSFKPMLTCACLFLASRLELALSPA